MEYQKDFDRIRHIKPIDELENIQLDDNDIAIIKKMYCKQTTTVEVNELEIE